MPADIMIRRLVGLFTESPDIEGQSNQLIQAENLTFEKNGVAVARPGFHFLANVLAGEKSCYFVGKFSLFDEVILTSENRYYVWDYTKIDPNIAVMDPVTVTSGSRTSNVVTLVVGASHGIVVNDQVIVTVADATYNGQFTVASVLTGPDRITYSQVAANDAASGAGTVEFIPVHATSGFLLVTPGAEYNFKLYWSNGKNYNGVIRNTPGQPSLDPGVMTVHADRMWLIATNGSSSRLYFSEPGDPESWPAANFIDVNPDSSLPTGLVSFQNRLYIFKEQDMWVLETPGVPTTWILRKFTSIGSMLRGVVEYQGILYWTFQTGVYRFDGGSIERISDPIQNEFDAAQYEDVEDSPGTALTPVAFKDILITSLNIGNNLRFFIYHIKLDAWTEWTFPWQEMLLGGPPDGVFPLSMWAEDIDTGVNPSEGGRAGIYVTVKDDSVTNHGMLLGTDFDPWIVAVASGSRTSNVVTLVVSADHGIAKNGTITVALADTTYNGVFTVTNVLTGPDRITYDQVASDDVASGVGTITNNNFFADQTGTRTGTPTVLEHSYDVVVQSKFSDYDGPYDQKRVLDWMLEFSGNVVQIDQVDTRQKVVSSIVYGDSDIGTINNQYSRKVRGFGYFRRLSYRLTASDFRDVGFKFYGLYARMRARGQPVKNQDQVTT